MGSVEYDYMVYLNVLDLEERHSIAAERHYDWWQECIITHFGYYDGSFDKYYDEYADLEYGINHGYIKDCLPRPVEYVIERMAEDAEQYN